MLIVKSSPFQALHNFSILGEYALNPRYDFLKILPQFLRVFILLVAAHVILNLSVRNPVKRLFQIILANGRAVYIIFTDLVRRSASFAKPPLGIGKPRPGMHGV